MLVAISALFLCILGCSAFNMGFVSSGKKVGQHNLLSMEYIPDGFTKAQWAEMKKKEAEKNKGKDLSKVGITKFQSRSFEAWQKSGQSHLYPVVPNTPVEKRPYMQRLGGSADGSDLEKTGKKGKDQAKPSRKTEVDLKYEKLNADGKLKSSPFTVPWTADAASKQFSGKREDGSQADKATQPKGTGAKAAPEAPKKKFFGLF